MGKRGPKPFEPGERQRKQVEAYVAYGVTRESMAELMGIGIEALEKHFKHELQTGLDKANSSVAQTLLMKALKGDTQCMTYWLSRRSKMFKEKQEVELTGANGGPVAVEQTLGEADRALIERYLKQRKKD